MRAKKWLTYITGILTIVSIIVILKIDEQAQSKEYNIFLAIFGSALLGMIMSLIEYISERRNAMETFWTEAKKALGCLKNMKPVMLEDEPKELILNCINEKSDNDAYDKWGNSAKIMGMEKSDKYLVKYEEWLEQNVPMSFTEDDDQDKIIRELADARINDVIAHLSKRINEYIEISKIDLELLDNAYGNLSFILSFFNWGFQNITYNKIYKEIHDIVFEIKKETEHFERWKNNKGSFIACCHKAIKLSEDYFEYRDDETKGFKNVCIYQTRFNKIEKSLEDFRCKIYLNTTKQEIEERPIYGEIITFNDDSK